MRKISMGAARALAIAALALVATRAGVEAQSRGDRARSEAAVDVTFRVDSQMERAIRTFYAERPATEVHALPPGIRRNLARGKPLPPGIAKKVAPPDLVVVLSLPRGFQVVEIGLDVFIVEVATAVVHDILMDVIR